MREDYTSVSVQAVIDCKCNTESAPTELRNSEAEYRAFLGPSRLPAFRGGLALRPGLPVPRAPEVGRSEVTMEVTNETSLTPRFGTANTRVQRYTVHPQRAPRGARAARAAPAAARPEAGSSGARPNPCKPAAPPRPAGTRLGPGRPRRDGRVWVVPGRGPGARRGGCGGGVVTSSTCAGRWPRIVRTPVKHPSSDKRHPVRTSTQGTSKDFWGKNGPPDTSTTRAGADAVGCSPRAPPRSSDVGKTLVSKSLDLHLVAHSLSSIIGSSSALRRVTFVLARGFFLCLV